MLFNKAESNKAAMEELIQHVGFLGAGMNFNRFVSDITHQETEIKKVISPAVFLIADTHYNSANYKDGSHDLEDELVFRIQAVVANLAYLDFAASNDLVHDTDGRQIRVSDERKPAFEWQIERHEQTILDKAYRLIDSLLEFIEANSDVGEFLEAWRSSTAYKTANRVFLNSAMKLDQYFPIEQSRRLYNQVIPFIDEVEIKHIKPRLGSERFEQLKTDLQSADGLSEDDEKFVSDYLERPIAQLCMAVAFRRLSVKIWPSGIIQRYSSDTQTMKASQPSPIHIAIQVAQELEKAGQEGIAKLDTYLKSLTITEVTEFNIDDIVKPADGSESFGMTL